ncbi:MAG: peptide chain release factor-like protein [Gemmatimonadales bacterium]|nr:MAG: peptide chain release factor-like protein [Gemmatimonadales bacterium]
MSRGQGYRIPSSDPELLADCRVDTFRAGGKGGQHQNTTESGVRLVHLPTGVVAISRDERSQHRNRQIAVRRLRKKLRELARPKPKRKKTRVPRREKRKRLENKKRKSRKKKLRKPPKRDDH